MLRTPLKISILIVLFIYSGIALSQTQTPFRSTSISDAYGQEQQTTAYGFVSIPNFNGGLEIGREIWKGDPANKEAQLVRVYSNYRWSNNGRLSRQVDDRVRNLQYQETRDQLDRVISEVRYIRGDTIEVQFFWEGGTNRCINARAMLESTLVASADVVKAEWKGEDRYLYVREIHYDLNGSGKGVYECISRFSIGVNSICIPFEKIDEKAQFGRKTHEYFHRWASSMNEF
ncbi:hypothetical protein K8I28_13390 [bacterium]|nr:hypothetical protein [bacterium]